MPQNANITINLEGLLQAISALGTAEYKLAAGYVNRLLEGVAAGQIDRWYHAQRTIAASGNEDLDFSGSLVNPLNATAVFARLKVLIVSAAAGNTNNVNVTRPAANGVPWALAASDGLAVAPGETKVLINRSDATGIVVTAGTGDLINFANSGAGTGVTYDIFALGCSA
ncbi:MAG TPA: hypothetical protein PLX85_00190 [Dehalococcoidia bacterium]|nr:hypothetical protein [Dehalococcoidia bacterium]